MSEYPKFWDDILIRLGLQSFDGIGEIKNVLNFMGFTTLQSIGKLVKPKEMSLFQIEVAKLKSNVQFCANYPDLQDWNLGLGTLAILKDISNAATSCMSYDGENLESVEESVKEKVHQRCIKVAPNLLLSNVLVNLNGKASCEIICPIDLCKDVTKLSLIKQVKPFAQPKFNTHNFERHVISQHLKKKRKREEETPVKIVTKHKNQVGNIHDETILNSIDCDISLKENENENRTLFRPARFFSSTPIRPQILAGHLQTTPKTANIIQLRKELLIANEKIKELEKNVPIATTPTPSSGASMTPKTARIEKLCMDLSMAAKMSSKTHEENIWLRHKCMDASGQIRTVCRIKPDTSGDCFDWRCSNDRTNIQICKYDNSKKYICF